MIPALASSSRSGCRVATAVRGYASFVPKKTPAAPAATGPAHAAPQDGKTDVLRATLYPANSVNPASASPIGARHPKHVERLAAVVPSEEAHETVERAWALYRRNERAARERALRAQYKAMVEACDELDAITKDGDRKIYDRAMVRMNHGSAAYQATLANAGQKKSVKSQWIEARPAGLVPREAWVPTETRGKGWNYDWTRPECEWQAEGCANGRERASHILHAFIPSTCSRWCRVYFRFSRARPGCRRRHHRFEEAWGLGQGDLGRAGREQGVLWNQLPRWVPSC